MINNTSNKPITMNKLSIITEVFDDAYLAHGKNGADMLRDCVDFLNARTETSNDKSPFDLLLEFAKTHL